MKKIPFQTWRLFWFGMTCAVKSRFANDPDRQKIYSYLAELTIVCLYFNRIGRAADILAHFDNTKVLIATVEAYKEARNAR